MSKEINLNQIGGVSGLIVRTMPEDILSVTDHLNQLEGVEVHLSEPDGKLIVHRRRNAWRKSHGRSNDRD